MTHEGNFATKISREKYKRKLEIRKNKKCCVSINRYYVYLISIIIVKREMTVCDRKSFILHTRDTHLCDTKFGLSSSQLGDGLIGALLNTI